MTKLARRSLAILLVNLGALSFSLDLHAAACEHRSRVRSGAYCKGFSEAREAVELHRLRYHPVRRF
jgi:hypothetical protein